MAVSGRDAARASLPKTSGIIAAPHGGGKQSPSLLSDGPHVPPGHEAARGCPGGSVTPQRPATVGAHVEGDVLYSVLSWERADALVVRNTNRHEVEARPRMDGAAYSSFLTWQPFGKEEPHQEMPATVRIGPCGVWVALCTRP